MLHHLAHLDVVIFSLINSHHTLFFDRFFLLVTWLGNGWVAVPAAGAALFLFTPRPLLARTLLVAAIAGVLTGICNTQIKRSIDRPRPLAYFAAASANGGPGRLHVLGERLRQHSFPSGHAATAFAAAAIIFLLLKKKCILVFIPAVLVAYSRVYLGAHFPLDTAGGAILGCCIPALVIFIFRRRRHPGFAGTTGGAHDSQPAGRRGAAGL